MDFIYLDHNATTPVHPDVFEAMKPFLTDQFGNASCLYPLGVEASYAVERARMQLAKLIGATEEEVFFTGCGTESDNLAIKGVVYATGKKHIITSKIEHPAIWQACNFLERFAGCRTTYVPVDSEGRVNPADVEAAIGDETAIVTVMLANNEIGTIQPVREIAEIAHRHGAVMHTDAIQAVGRIPLDVNELGVDLLSVSGHKLYGPKGVGALYVKQGTEIQNVMNGGRQESGMRGGTENVAGIAGLGKAAAIARKELDARQQQSASIRDRLWEAIHAFDASITRNSPVEGCLPGTLNVTIPNINAREFVRAMGDRGVYLSSGSACSSGKTKPSHVIKAIGRSDEDAKSAIRLSCGCANQDTDPDRFMEVFKEVVVEVRQTVTA